ncbi:MAG: Autolysin [Bacteroidia bacterium]|nr:Autolysin [Bacteroidia bacterium]
MKRFLSLSFIFILVASSVAQTQPAEERYSRQDYISMYRGAAVKEMLISGVPASITLSQGILESGDGNSTLARKANNHFGIKCHEWTGEKFYMDDDHKGECFRVYKSVFDSYDDHSQFLKTRSRYAGLFQLEKTDYKGWAKGLKDAGYATNPKYPELLIKIIEENQLHQYDLLTEVPKDFDKLIVEENTVKSDATSTATAGKILLHNRIKYITVQPGDTYFSICKKHEMVLWQILKYNDLSKDDTLIPGQKIYLQPKRYKGDEEFHVVKQGETMRDISQQHGIKLKTLYKKNNMVAGTEPKVGDKLNLKSKKR